MLKPATKNLLLLIAALLPIAQARAVTPAETPYVGGYTSGSVDTRTQLMLLDDNTFCFTFMGGSLDLLAGGRWKALPGKDGGVRLQEVRQQSPAFPAFTKKMAEQGKRVVFDFHGYSLSNANGPVFAVSADETAPNLFRPLFANGNHSWSESYLLPAMDADAVRYFFIGESGADTQGRLIGKVKVVQYRLTDANTVRIGYDQQQASPPMDMQALLKGEVLHVDGERFGKRDTLPAQVIPEIREACIAPALGTDAEALRKSGRDKALVPVRTFEIDRAAVSGEPFFGKSN
jgi:hypothetical protein